MATNYRIQYKIVELGKTYAGIRVVEQPIDEYMKHIHDTYQYATYVYVELIEEFEQVDGSAEESVILLSLDSLD